MLLAITRLMFLFLLLFGIQAGASLAQENRTPEQNMQYHRAKTAWQSGSSMLEAKARIDRVLKDLPDDVEALNLRAKILLALERPEEALADAQHAVGLRPEDAEANLILCEAARQLGQTEIAEEALNKAASQAVDDASLHVRLSWNALLLGQLEKAESFARVAWASQPDNAIASLQLARVFVLKNQPEEAAKVLQRGLKQALFDMKIIVQDTVLVRVSDHALLRTYH